MTPPIASPSPAADATHAATAAAISVLPARYNAAADLLSRNLAAGRADKIAYVDDAGLLSFAALDQRCRRFAAALLHAGIRPEERLLLCALDTVDFPTVFLGCLLASM